LQESELPFILETKEVYQDDTNRADLFAVYTTNSIPSNMRGVPTSVVNTYTVIIGSMPDEYWEELITACNEYNCPQGYFTHKNIRAALAGEKINETENALGLEIVPEDGLENGVTWSVLIGAALIDSVNPCTIAVIAMLLATILIQSGRKKVVLAGLAFSLTIFVCYMLMGLGIIQAITAAGIAGVFFIIVTILALVISILEFRAYINYKPGFLAIEMPKFLRPHAKGVLSKATTLPLVIVAAIFCSLFLLPCSSGPYLVVLSLLAKAKTFGHIMYLVVYNFFFILPMLLITMIIGIGVASPEKVQEAKEKHIKNIHLISGLIMFLLFILLVLQQIGVI